MRLFNSAHTKKQEGSEDSLFDRNGDCKKDAAGGVKPKFIETASFSKKRISKAPIKFDPDLSIRESQVLSPLSPSIPSFAPSFLLFFCIPPIILPWHHFLLSSFPS